MRRDEIEARRKAHVAALPLRARLHRWWLIHWPPLFCGTALVVGLTALAILAVGALT